MRDINMSNIFYYKYKHNGHYRTDCLEKDINAHEDMENIGVTYFSKVLEVIEDIFIDGDLASIIIFGNQDNFYKGCMLDIDASYHLCIVWECFINY